MDASLLLLKGVVLVWQSLTIIPEIFPQGLSANDANSIEFHEWITAPAHWQKVWP